VRVRGFRQLNVRNLVTERLSFEDGVTAVVGPNATGKSNLLEALRLALEGTLVGHRVTDALRFGCAEGYVRADVVTADGPHTLEVGLAPGRKQVRLDGQVVRALDVAGLGGVVLVAPEDVDLVHGPPARRRAFLDHLLGRLSLRYALVLRAYQRVVDQRNALLREGDPGTMLRAWDARFVTLGEEVTALRQRATGSLAERAAQAYDRIAGGAHGFEVVLERSDDLAAALAASGAAERARGVTLVGPHRDDLRLRLGGHSVQAFASRGEARTAALALRVAEAALLEARHGVPPLLLIDDVNAELDECRRGFLTTLARAAPQAIVTSTETPPDVGRVWSIDGGRVDTGAPRSVGARDGA
jgi:DNA replication and repair protein RecF